MKVYFFLYKFCMRSFVVIFFQFRLRIQQIKLKLNMRWNGEIVAINVRWRCGVQRLVLPIPKIVKSWVKHVVVGRHSHERPLGCVDEHPVVLCPNWLSLDR
jgi:hypothetical protein